MCALLPQQVLLLLLMALCRQKASLGWFGSALSCALHIKKKNQGTERTGVVLSFTIVLLLYYMLSYYLHQSIDPFSMQIGHSIASVSHPLHPEA